MTIEELLAIEQRRIGESYEFVFCPCDFGYALQYVYGDPLYQSWRTTLKQLLERELKLEPLHFDCFEFSGKVIALALMHEVQVGVAFHRLFLLPLAGEEISVKDLRDANPSLYNNKAKHRFHDDDEILDDFINSMSEQISFFRKGFNSVFGKSIDKLLKYRGIDVEDLNLVLKGDLNLGFNSCERTHVNHGNNESEPLMSQFLKINRQRLKITKSKWQKDGKKPLGAGGFGDVYKGYAAGGFFFAVKSYEVSAWDNTLDGPEVIKQDKEYGFKADIWSFGCTVLEMLIGNIPYSHLKNLNANLELEVQKGSIIDHLPNYSLSENSLDFIKQCLKRNPNKRQTADELLKHPFVNDSGF
ncbi:hypothetical protein GH714_006282 [Hevea brasiliensis]|uniref:mitogen-activated protein kinase kinase kinase n=1 Tax=Hevea brasiliensis TaxID=3981 RepID=A0A6A6KZJ9_HEVBR|nr:hypothetical protein GH714_006282 [Hevea brasiliensis]